MRILRPQTDPSDQVNAQSQKTFVSFCFSASFYFSSLFFLLFFCPFESLPEFPACACAIIIFFMGCGLTSILTISSYRTNVDNLRNRERKINCVGMGVSVSMGMDVGVGVGVGVGKGVATVVPGNARIWPWKV